MIFELIYLTIFIFIVLEALSASTFFLATTARGALYSVKLYWEGPPDRLDALRQSRAIPGGLQPRASCLCQFRRQTPARRPRERRRPMEADIGGIIFKVLSKPGLPRSGEEVLNMPAQALRYLLPLP